MFSLFYTMFAEECSVEVWMKNGPHRLLCVNTWFPAGGTVWEGLGGIALLGKVCHWEWTLRFQQTANTPSWLSLCLKM